MEGILPLFKPKGMTSHDCVFKLRRILKMKKIGHTGTLDPDVDGVLPICLGRATKVAEYVTNAGKAYEGEVTIGQATTTEDASGEIILQKDVDKSFSRAEIVEMLESLTGEITQTPPMYSAVKVKGKRLYEYARQGIEVERPTRIVNIYSIDLLDDQEMFTGNPLKFRFRVYCGKGTYIRTLAVMMGERLGLPAHMSMLSRIKAASFSIDDCFTFSEVEKLVEDGSFSEHLRPMEEALSHLPKLVINDKLANRVKNGAVLPIPDHLQDLTKPIVMETKEGLAIAIYRAHSEKKGLMKPEKVLRNDFLAERP